MRLSGVKLKHRKHTSHSVPEKLPVPEYVVIPMSMHIGKPANPIVKVGQRVTVGELIGEADGFVSSPVYSSVSGKVKKISTVTVYGGMKTQAVEIETDGLQEICETVKPPTVNDFDSFVKAIKDSGITGLGGAGFPTFIKIGVKDISMAKAVIINSAECEPYITSDTRTMLDKADYIFKGIDLVQKYLEPNTVIIGIENNKKSSIAKMKEMAQTRDNVQVKVLPAV